MDLNHIPKNVECLTSTCLCTEFSNHLTCLRRISYLTIFAHSIQLPLSILAAPCNLYNGTGGVAVPAREDPRFQSLNLSVDLVIGLLQPLVHTVESKTMLAAIGHLPRGNSSDRPTLSLVVTTPFVGIRYTI